MRETPIIMIMFAIVISALAIVSLATYYGADWTWIGEQVAVFFMLFIVLGTAVFTLFGWMRK